MADVAFAKPQVAPLPAEETTVRLPPWVDRWFEKGAPFATALAIGLPVFAFANVFIIGFGGDGCYDCNVFELYGVVSYGLIITLWIVSVATVFGRRSARRAQRDQMGPYTGLAQGAKDWFVRGDITEAEFNRLREIVEPALEGKTEDHRIRKAASMLGWVAGLTVIFLAPLIFFSVIVVAVEADSFFLFVGFPLFSLFLLVLGITSLTGSRRCHRVANELGKQLLERIRAAEEEIIKAAHARSTKAAPAPAPSTAGNPYGPSFRSYSGR